MKDISMLGSKLPDDAAAIAQGFKIFSAYFLARILIYFNELHGCASEISTLPLIF